MLSNQVFMRLRSEGSAKFVEAGPGLYMWSVHQEDLSVNVTFRLVSHYLSPLSVQVRPCIVLYSISPARWRGSGTGWAPAPPVSVSTTPSQRSRYSRASQFTIYGRHKLKLIKFIKHNNKIQFPSVILETAVICRRWRTR